MGGAANALGDGDGVTRARIFERGLSATLIGLASAIGALAFLSPFVWLARQEALGGALPARGDSPLLLIGLLTLCVAALVIEAQTGLQSGVANVKMLALMAVLVGINSALRLAETIVPGPGGFTPIFALVILAGYVFGARVGFLTGALTMLVSALVTGGVGPWLPYQMFTAGWMGLAAGWLGNALRRRIASPRAELVALIAFGALSGFAYGVVMNLWEWPYIAGSAAQSYQAGLSVSQAVQRYAVYYALTSSWWDLFGAAGNVLLLALFGGATLRVLRRYQAKLHVEVTASHLKNA